MISERTPEALTHCVEQVSGDGNGFIIHICRGKHRWQRR